MQILALEGFTSWFMTFLDLFPSDTALEALFL